MTAATGYWTSRNPGAPRTVSDADVERVVTRTLETLPRSATQWSTRSMAKECGLSFATVGRIWRAFGLKPHRSETFKLSTDPLFIEKVRDIVGLYLHPPERAVVLFSGREVADPGAGAHPASAAATTGGAAAALRTTTSGTARPLLFAALNAAIKIGEVIGIVLTGGNRSVGVPRGSCGVMSSTGGAGAKLDECTWYSWLPTARVRTRQRSFGD